MTEYSQNGEQSFILASVERCAKKYGEAYNLKPPFKFLDIGAWNAKIFSNTRALYEAGWNGVMVEPSPRPMEGLLAEYGAETGLRVELIQAAVGVDSGLTRMHITTDALSTSSEESFAQWSKENNKGGFYGSMFVPQITPAQIFERFGADFQFINIDTEGSSFEVLKAIFALQVHPWCFCFEHDGRFAESFALFDPIGYKLVHENDTNRVISL